MPAQSRTLAQALRDAGYETAISGKWHLGHFRPEYLPTHRGFDHQYGPLPLPANWEWFGIQLNDGREITAYNVRQFHTQNSLTRSASTASPLAAR